ncbi:hypothetical protein [Bartonella sp. HY761]|uniref:hypothetical protein n=1 Tax=Bartonella sp. HY761 TaxID=2979330 RepID=UPI0021FB3750|nr:hypothetical protein [Bartonella sp. HY761]UXN05233.1 hypothetical protein N6A79_07845 [Bartonella sp. HY761]
MAESQKKVKLRVFTITSLDLKKNADDLVHDFSAQLDASKDAEQRIVKINSSSEEGDLCCEFKKEMIDNAEQLFGTMITIKSSSDIGNIPKDFLIRKTFALSEIKEKESQTSDLKTISEFYYLIKGKYLVCNLPGNKTIKRFEAYISSLLKTNNYNLSPKIAPQHAAKLSDLKLIKVGPNFSFNKNQQETQKKSFSIKNSVSEVLAKIVGDSPSLKDVNLEDILTAELILKVKKPRAMSDEDFEKSYGALLRPVADTDDITLTDRKGNTYKGSEIECKEEIEVTLTEDGAISEPELKMAMRRYIDQIEQS